MAQGPRLPSLQSLIAAYEPTRRDRRPGLGLGATMIDGEEVGVVEEVIVDAPFYRLLRFRRGGRREDPQILVVPPLSGHFSALLRDLLDALLPAHDLYLVDWRDARDIAPEKGPFGLDHNIAVIIDCLQAIEGEVHLIGVCQSATPVLAATALLAGQEASDQPASMVLINGMIDPGIRPTRLARTFASRSTEWIERYALSEVSAPFAGAGRLVYPAALQHRAMLSYLARHLATGAELFGKVWYDDGADPEGHPFIEAYLSVMDLPAQILLDTARLVFRQAALARGAMVWRGELLDPAAIRRTSLMTIEGGRDDVSGVGQTEFAHRLCINIPATQRVHHLQADVGHFGTFHGRIWRDEIRPRVEAFIRTPRPRTAARHRSKPHRAARDRSESQQT